MPYDKIFLAFFFRTIYAVKKYFKKMILITLTEDVFVFISKVLSLEIWSDKGARLKECWIARIIIVSIERVLAENVY